jgi:hypothetical protein
VVAVSFLQPGERRHLRRACLDFCVLRHSMSTKKDMYATQDDEESDSPSIGTAA